MENQDNNQQHEAQEEEPQLRIEISGLDLVPDDMFDAMMGRAFAFIGAQFAMERMRRDGAAFAMEMQEVFEARAEDFARIERLIEMCNTPVSQYEVSE